MDPSDTPKCFASHMGVWAMAPEAVHYTVAAVRAGAPPIAPSPYGELLTHDGVAIIDMIGPMSKGRSKFGGASTVAARQLLRLANADESIHTVLFKIESPGGMVAGTKELYDEIVASPKQTIAYGEDILASAAYWVASAADKIYCNEMCHVGSIGVFAVLEDTSNAYERDGIEVKVVSSGGVKGAMADGVPLTDEVVGEVQDQVDHINQIMTSNIKSNRGQIDIEAVNDGRTYHAERALELGLVDGILPLEQVFFTIARRARAAALTRRLSTTYGVSEK
jgi:signal peptide peptidase SppA